LPRLPRETDAQALAPEADELLAELSEVPRQPDESVVRQRRHQGEQLVLRLAAETGQAARRAAGVRGHAPGPAQWLLLPGLQPACLVPGQGEARRRTVQAEVSGHHRSARDRNLGVLE